jgi:hypothetical protein
MGWSPWRAPPSEAKREAARRMTAKRLAGSSGERAERSSGAADHGDDHLAARGADAAD